MAGVFEHKIHIITIVDYLCIELLDNWGSKDQIGLAGISLIDEHGKSINPTNINNLIVVSFSQLCSLNGDK